MVRDCLTRLSVEPDWEGAEERRKPLMSSIRGLVEEPEAELGAWVEEAERC